MTRGGRAVRLAASVALSGLLAVPGAPLADEPRQVLGTMSVRGDVRIRDQAGEAGASTGVPLLEASTVTVADKSAALLNLTADGMIGLRAGGTLELGRRGSDGFRVALRAGQLLLRLPVGSRMTLVTSSAAIGPDTLVPAAATTPPAAEASVTVLPDGQTIVRVEAGSLRVEGAHGGPTIVRAEEQATLAPDASPRVAAASTAPPTPAVAEPAAAAPAAKPAGSGIFSGDHDLALLLGAGAVVVGGTLGGLAASGAFDDGGSDDGGGGASAAASRVRAGQGSAFRAAR